jgi:hypothetical protein
MALHTAGSAKEFTFFFPEAEILERKFAFQSLLEGTF